MRQSFELETEAQTPALRSGLRRETYTLEIEFLPFVCTFKRTRQFPT